MSFLDKLFRIDKKAFKKIEKKSAKVFDYEDIMAKKTDDELKAMTPYLKDKLKNGATIDDILPEAFATCREAAKRVLHQFPYPVQVFGATVLNEGDVAEMKTGEGKTLTATMAVYLNALEGLGVHVVTVNEYLAQRDAEWMGSIYRFLGLTVGVNLREKSVREKQEAFNCDITYTTNSELGFDYLRDNMAKSASNRVLRKLHYAIVDEADSILVDESRTPLIISGGSGITASSYETADRAVKMMRKDRDYTIDIEKKVAKLTDKGVDEVQKIFSIENLYDAKWTDLTHRVTQALKANYIMKKDVEYMVNENEILLIDSFTGRVMKGREYSDGLQQALQAKEHVAIKPETVTLATITYQNFFRLYDKLAGMTGTAKTEEEEFRKVYNMRVVCIPTNKPIARFDDEDSIFGNMESKYDAMLKDIIDRHKHGQPILIGTPSVEVSEVVSLKLDQANIPHEVLNAKNHAKEAAIIAQAGQRNAVTIATNMAGRGTDIKLGEGVTSLSKDEQEQARRHYNGLAVISCERNESRRIDNQLKGRSGRQGDPGYSKFYVSFDDELFLRFATQGAKNLFEKMGDEAIESKLMSNTITQCQKRVEGQNFDTRKNLLNYDDVLSKQRKVMYERRDKIIYGKTIRDTIPGYFDLAAKKVCDQSYHIKDQERVIIASKLHDAILSELQIDLDVSKFDEEPYDDIIEILSAKILKIYNTKCKQWTEDMRDYAEKTVTLDCIDRRWTAHIEKMSKLREGIWLRGYGQTDPLQAYTNEGFEMFSIMNENISIDVVKTLLHVEFEIQPKNTIEVEPLKQETKVPQVEQVNNDLTNTPEQEQVKAESKVSTKKGKGGKKTKTKIAETDNGDTLVSNIKPDDDLVDRSNPTSKIN